MIDSITLAEKYTKLFNGFDEDALVAKIAIRTTNH